MAILVGSATLRDTEIDNGTLNLASAYGTHAVTVGARTFVYGAGVADNGISGFELGADGSLTNVVNVKDTDNVAFELAGATNFASARVGGTTYLYVNGNSDNGISAFRVEANGTLTNVFNVNDAGAPLELQGDEGRMSVATVGTKTYLIATGFLDNGFSVFEIAANGSLINTDNETNGPTLELGGAEGSATATINGRTFVFIAGYLDSGVSVYELDSTGNVTFRSSVDDASNPALQLSSAFGVASAVVGGTTYLIASGATDAGLSVFSVSGNGQLTNVFNIEDSALLGLNGASALTTRVLDGETFVLVSGRIDGALSVFHLGAGGQLTNVTTVFDNVATGFGGTYGSDFATVGGRTLFVGVGQSDSGITSFDLGSANDTLNGTADNDIILGLAGNDDLRGGRGNDRVVGGAGDDLVQGQAGRDRLLGYNGRDDLQGGNDNDDLKGGGQADILSGGKGRDVMAGEGGADDFVFTNVRDSGITAGSRDVITDFRGRDDLVFTDIDAVKGQPGNQDFTFDVGGAFGAGELRFREVAKGVLVELNVDSDSAAEFSILLKDFVGILNANDFEV